MVAKKKKKKNVLENTEWIEYSLVNRIVFGGTVNLEVTIIYPEPPYYKPGEAIRITQALSLGSLYYYKVFRHGKTNKNMKPNAVPAGTTKKLKKVLEG